jgi:hypothetical protein
MVPTTTVVILMSSKIVNLLFLIKLPGYFQSHSQRAIIVGNWGIKQNCFDLSVVLFQCRLRNTTVCAPLTEDKMTVLIL